MSAWPKNSRDFLSHIGISNPIIQAPMAGGPTTAELISAVSNAGGLGSLGAGYLSPDDLDTAITEIKAKTSKPFAINLMVPEQQVCDHRASARLQAKMQEYCDELDIGKAQDRRTKNFGFANQLAVVLEHNVPVVSFTFGIPKAEEIAAMKAKGVFCVGSATCVVEGRLLYEAGCDAIVAQGIEAGGHRASFAEPERLPQVTTLALVPLLSDAVPIPIIASGGIMDGRGIVAALALGASAVQLGTAFLGCTESGAADCWKETLQSSSDTSTVLTKAFSGKTARGIRNRFAEEFEELEDQLPPYPVHNGQTKAIRTAAKQQGRTEFMSLWAGQAASLSRTLPAADLVELLCKEVEEVLAEFPSAQLDD